MLLQGVICVKMPNWQFGISTATCRHFELWCACFVRLFWANTWHRTSYLPLLPFPLFSVAVTLTPSLDDVVIHSQLFSTLDASTSAHINITLPPQELLNEGMSLKSLHYPWKGTKIQEAPLKNWCCRYQISVPPVPNSR
jgi:hypothetical protein